MRGQRYSVNDLFNVPRVVNSCAGGERDGLSCCLPVCLPVCLPDTKIEGQFNDLPLVTSFTSIRPFLCLLKMLHSLPWVYLPSVKSCFCLLPAWYWVDGNHILVPKQITAVLAWFPVLVMTCWLFLRTSTLCRLSRPNQFLLTRPYECKFKLVVLNSQHGSLTFSLDVLISSHEWSTLTRTCPHSTSPDKVASSTVNDEL